MLRFRSIIGILALTVILSASCGVKNPVNSVYEKIKTELDIDDQQSSETAKPVSGVQQSSNTPDKE